MEMISFLMPLLLIPGVALLIGAASTRYGYFQQEVHHLLDDGQKLTDATHSQVKARLLHFRNALVCLHSGASLFAISSVVGVLLEMVQIAYAQMVIGITTVGIIVVMLGIVELIRESLRSHDVMLDHLDTLKR